MSKHGKQNPVYIATTISVYLGLVLVGASPQVFAAGGFSGDSQSRIFEFTSKTNSVLSKLKLRQESDVDKTTDFPAPGGAPSLAVRRPAQVAVFLPAVEFSGKTDRNEKVLTVSVLPRASI